MQGKDINSQFCGQAGKGPEWRMENESVCINDPNEDWQVEEERGRAGEGRQTHHIGTRQLKLRPECKFKQKIRQRATFPVG